MRFLSMYSIRFTAAITYMLQTSEYATYAYVKWFWRMPHFNTIMNRSTLEKTNVAKLILVFLRVGMLLQIIIALIFIVLGLTAYNWYQIALGVIIFLVAPFVWAHLVLIPTGLARKFVIEPRYRAQQSETHRILSEHKAIKIAVAGSYGKTTMKEILVSVLGQGKKVAATPANKNVAVAHYQFARSLTGDEEVIVIEYGESKPGDVERFAYTTCPDVGIITGLAPAHLDGYGSLEAAGKDIFSLADYLKDENIYVNDEPAEIKPFIKPTHMTYSRERVGQYSIANIQMSIVGTTFNLKMDTQELTLHSQLLGAHLVGALSTAAVIGTKLGLSPDQVSKGVGATTPYEHRMQPYQLAGAWIIDDAYNGNLEGIRAGTQLFASLSATRKIYVTPGLVEQGEETQRVHIEVGRLIAAAHPDIVILMHNSTTTYIQDGLHQANYEGTVRVETEPLKFYTNLDQFVANGDLVMLQNDWTDNYN